MFSAVATNDHTLRWGGKPVVMKRGATQSNAEKRDNGAHFQTASPLGVAFGCPHEKVTVVKNEKESLRGKFNPCPLQHLHGPGHLLHEVGVVVGLSISESYKSCQTQPLQFGCQSVKNFV